MKTKCVLLVAAAVTTLCVVVGCSKQEKAEPRDAKIAALEERLKVLEANATDLSNRFAYYAEGWNDEWNRFNTNLDNNYGDMLGRLDALESTQGKPAARHGDAPARSGKMSPQQYKKWYVDQSAGDAQAKSTWRKKHEVAQMAVIVYGKVLQNIDSGLLVTSRDYSTKGVNSFGDEISTAPPDPSNIPSDVDRNHKWAWLNELVLVTGCSNKGNVVDEDTVNLVVYPVGNYEYTTTANSKKTIRRYTASLDEAAAYWSGAMAAK